MPPKKTAKKVTIRRSSMTLLAKAQGTVELLKGKDGYIYLKFRLEDDKLFDREME